MVWCRNGNARKEVTNINRETSGDPEPFIAGKNVFTHSGLARESCDYLGCYSHNHMLFTDINSKLKYTE